MSAHKIQKGMCVHCGCDVNAIEYFGWSCTGRVVEHSFQNGTCTNCGFCKDVIEHFDWPCRLDYRERESFRGSDRTSDRRAKQRANRQSSCEDHYQEWTHPNDEIRYGRLLGLRGKVTKFDIRCAYREQASLYHPDKVAHMASDIQELATEKMKEINLAFSYFQNKYGL